MFPAVGAEGPDFVMLTSAWVFTEAVTEDELLPGFGSEVDELTLAVLVMEPAALAAT